MKQYFLEQVRSELSSRAADLADVDMPMDADLAIPCFAVSKKLGRSPQDIAVGLAQGLSLEYIDRVQADGGYVNIWLKSSALAVGLAEDCKRVQNYGDYTTGRGQTVLCEFPSPNMAKPYSVGHLRPALQGWALYKLMLAMGYAVVSDDHLGDYGTSSGRWAVGFKRYSTQKKLEQRGIYELADVYIKITEALTQEKEAGQSELADQVQEWLLKLGKKDPEAVALSQQFNQISLDHIHTVLSRLSIKTDEELGESFYVDEGQRMVDQLLKSGVAEQGADGSVVVRLDSHGIETPILIRKSNGAALYATTTWPLSSTGSSGGIRPKYFYLLGVNNSFIFSNCLRWLTYGGMGTLSRITSGIA